MSTGLVLSGWSVLSGYGVGTEPFVEGIASGRSAVGDTAADAGPFGALAPVPGFDVVSRLGSKGTRKMDRMTGIAVTAVGELLESCPPGADEGPDRLGLVLGTGSGSLQSIMGFTRESFLGSKPYHVDAARFPNTVMNRAAGQSAIWHHITGPNATIAGGRLTGLLALSYAVRMHGGGHCERVLWGAVEECSDERSWVEGRARTGEGPGGPLGEGGAVFLLEPRAAATAAGRSPLAAVMGTRFGAFDDPSSAGDAIERCVGALLGSTGIGADDVTLVVPHDDPGELGEQERAGVRAALGTAEPRWLHCRPLLGDLSAAATALHLAAALADGTANAAAGGRPATALVTAVDPGGAVGAALLRSEGA